jgi:hypothetical protein
MIFPNMLIDGSQWPASKAERHVLLTNRADVAARSRNLTTCDSLANAKSNAGMKLRRGKMTAE